MTTRNSFGSGTYGLWPTGGDIPLGKFSDWRCLHTPVERGFEGGLPIEKATLQCSYRGGVVMGLARCPVNAKGDDDTTLRLADAKHRGVTVALGCVSVPMPGQLPVQRHPNQ
jgi:hypothetical protein